MATGELKMIGPYEVRGVLGRGGMATVYRAYQSSLDREVAVKVMSNQFADDPNFMERFRREARSIAKLDHPNILAVYDFGQDGNVPYIVTQLLEGKTLRERLGQPLDPRLAAKITTQIGAALQYAHERGMVHRDVKPSNVLMDKRDRAVLSDFGIVKLMQSDSDLTGTGLGVGTPEYMSPEQGMGEGLDGRSDLYSLGVMLYEMLTGVTPFKADTPLAVMMGHVNRPLPDPLKHNPQLTPQMVAVLFKALAKHRDERFTDVDQFADSFNEAVYAAGLPPLPSSSGSTAKASTQGLRGTGTQPAVGAGPAFGVMDSTRVAGAGQTPPGQPITGSNPAMPLPALQTGLDPVMPLPPVTNASNPAVPLPPVTNGSNPNLHNLPTEFMAGLAASQARPATNPPVLPVTPSAEMPRTNNFTAAPGEATIVSTQKKNSNIVPPVGFNPASPEEPTVTAGATEVTKVAEARAAAKAAQFRATAGEVTKFAGQPAVPGAGEVTKFAGPPAVTNAGEATLRSGPHTGEATIYAGGPFAGGPKPPTNPQPFAPPPNYQFNRQGSGTYTLPPVQPLNPPPSNLAGVGYSPYNTSGSGYNPAPASGSTGNTPPPQNYTAAKEPQRKRGLAFILIGVIVAALVVIAVAAILLSGGGSPSPTATATVNAVVQPTATAATTPSVVAATTAPATTALVTTVAVIQPTATTAVTPSVQATAAPAATVAPTNTAVATATPAPTATSAPTGTPLPALAVLNVGTSRRGDTDIAQPEDVTDQFIAGQEVFVFIHADNSQPNVDKVEVTVIKDGAAQPVKSVTLTKASGFNFFSLDKPGVGSYRLEVRYNGNLVGKQSEFKVVAAPTAAPTTAPIVNKTTAPVIKTTAPVVRTTAPPVKTTPPVVKQPTPTPCPPGSC